MIADYRSFVLLHTEINLSLNLKRCKGKLTIKQVSNRVFLAGNWCVPVVIAGRPNRKLRFVNVSCVLSITSYFNIKLVSFIHIDWQVPFRVISFSHLFVLSWKWLLYQKQVRWAFFPFQTRDVFFVSSQLVTKAKLAAGRAWWETFALFLFSSCASFFTLSFVDFVPK